MKAQINNTITGAFISEINHTNTKDVLSVDTSKFPAGIYYIQIDSDTYKKTLRFVKNEK